MSDLRGILWEATLAKVGIEVIVSDVETFKRRFYSTRAKAREEGNFAFDGLQLITPPADLQNRWWILNGQVERKEEGEAGQEKPETL